MNNNMVDVLLGLQWGDEGKGKLVDVLAPRYNVIARFQGGPNAGHTLEFNGIKHVLHTIPSGIFHADKANVIGNGVVIDPVIFKREVDKLAAMNVDVKNNLYVSRKAHLILPTHRMLDAASEASKGHHKIGSTLKGIGPTYMDKTGRNGLRVGDIESPQFKDRYNSLKTKHQDLLKFYEYTPEGDYDEKAWFEGIEFLKTMNLVDSEQMINDQINKGQKILAEGAQGSLLDIDFGSYPFVTSSNTVTAGTCTGLGISPKKIGEVFGIFKAYCTRVGSGPFPTELINSIGDTIRKQGNEFGSTTGRPRRCGWLDLPALRYSIMINGVTQLFMTKADVLSGFKTLQVCTHYIYNGKQIDYMPFDIVHNEVKPVYIELEGWSENLTEVKNEEHLPKALIDYIHFIEKELEVPISIVSVGPDRTQILERHLTVPAR